MSKYIKSLRELFPSAINIEQIGSKQIAIVIQPEGLTELYSYSTKVGIFKEGIWYLTTAKYSHTTSRQLTEFSRNCDKIEWVKDIDTIGE
jgi:hypothetical protein